MDKTKLKPCPNCNRSGKTLLLTALCLTDFELANSENTSLNVRIVIGAEKQKCFYGEQ